MSFELKYLKYKKKYLELSSLIGGTFTVEEQRESLKEI